MNLDLGVNFVLRKDNGCRAKSFDNRSDIGANSGACEKCRHFPLLRQPLEDGQVTIARAHSTLRFPARFMLVAAMNPTPKGHAPTDEISQRQMERYLSRISGPLIDRIDLHIEVPTVPYKQLTGAQRGTDSAQMRSRVLAARERQALRYADRPFTTNAELRAADLSRDCALDAECRTLLERALTALGLSMRAVTRVLRVARTIADLSGEAQIAPAHLAESIGYRGLDRG